MRCWKCFRKELLSLALSPHKEIDLISMMRNSSEIQIKLSSYPISHENVVTYSIQRVDIGRYQFLRPLRDRLDTELDLSLLDCWYSPSKVLIPEKYRVSVMEKISKFLKKMTREQEEILETWNMDDYLLSEEAKKSHSRLTTSWQDL